MQRLAGLYHALELQELRRRLLQVLNIQHAVVLVATFARARLHGNWLGNDLVSGL
eukprot:SAG11_NODE_6156_length_1375_cov_0.826019_1_plen_55_part_00